jgi:putative ABC transport system substrate-binding protein
MFSSVAPAFAIEPIAILVKDSNDVERSIKSLAQRPHSALIVAGDSLVETPSIRRLIVELTATHRLPALYGALSFASEGAFIVYGIDITEEYHLAASYVDRILKGEKPEDLPVQQPSRFHFVINMKAAKELGLQLSPTLVAATDEVIE